MIFVIATIEVAEGKRDAYLEELQKNVPLVRQEAGCVEYNPTVDAETDIEAQIPVRNNIVTVVETWESLDALKAHLVAPHMQEYRARVKDLVTSTKLHVLQPI